MCAALRFPHGDDDRLAFTEDHRAETSTQACDAIEALNRADTDWVPWPWPDLTALAGRMKPRDVWFVCGFSGNGKTLFVSSAIQTWIQQRIKVYVLPLENAADDFRIYLACQTVGIDPGIVNGGGLLDMTPGQREYWEGKIRAELERQMLDAGIHDYLKVKGVDSINLKRLRLAAEEAAKWGAQVLIVDHIDHIKGGDGKNLHAESTLVNQAAKDLAKEFNLVFVFTSQMNNDAIKGGRDRLAQYGPPMPHHVFMGGHKRFIATGMIGLHRKLRDPHDMETEKEYKAAMQRSRDGDSPPMDALAPNVMAVTLMKSRNFGAREGNRAFLAVSHGLVTHLSEKDRMRTTHESQRRA
jgi:KaiC/GvpD/RAD55 family RecA-like ATPase